MITLTDVQTLVDQFEDAYKKNDVVEGRKKWIKIKNSIDRLNLSSFDRVRLTKSIYANLCRLESDPHPIKVDKLLDSNEEIEIPDPSESWIPF